MELQKKLRKYAQNKFLKNVSILAGGTAFAQILVIAASPLITRLYSPEDFGVLAIFAALLGILGTSSSLKYNLAIPLPEKDIDALELLILSLTINIAYAFLTGVLLYLLIPLILKLSNISLIIPYLWIIPLSIFGFGTYESLKYWAIRENLFTSIAKTKISQNTALIATQTSMGYFLGGPLGLLIGDAIGRMGGTLSLAYLVIKKIRSEHSQITLGGIKKQAIRYKRFPLYSSGSGVINALGLQLTPLLIVSILGPAVAGLFALTQRITSTPMSLIGQSYSQVYYKEASEIIRKSKHSLKNSFIKQSKILLLLGIIPAIIFLTLGQTGFGFIFGQEWRTSGLYAQIITPMLVLQFIVVPLSQTLNILGKQNLQLLWDIARLMAILICFGGIKALQLNAVQAITAISLTMATLYMVLYLIILKQISK